MNAEPTASFRWWLKLQIGLALGGGAVWVAGAFFQSDFVAGVGFGLLAAALVLRVGRRDAEEKAAEDQEEAAAEKTGEA